jgi:dimethylaniline monooxygenase (N-oxide forming)
MADYVSTYPHHEHIVKYFNDYADEFGVRKYVRFNTQVVSVEQNTATGKWTVKTRPSDGTPLYLAGKAQFNDSDLKTEEFDAVMIANGHHSVPVREIISNNLGLR